MAFFPDIFLKYNWSSNFFCKFLFLKKVSDKSVLAVSKFCKSDFKPWKAWLSNKSLFSVIHLCKAFWLNSPVSGLIAAALAFLKIIFKVPLMVLGKSSAPSKLFFCAKLPISNICLTLKLVASAPPEKSLSSKVSGLFL